jgi:hypothetical protein
LKAARLPHDRGGILLAAVFSAFLSIYKARSADLFRIATNGTGVLREGEIHPDLVRRLAREASAAADAVLTMCIRGFDYCPPVDIDFGTYLRGVITADAEVYPQDQNNHRVAFIEAFRQWGIYPEGIRSMAESDIRYPRLGEELGPAASRYDQTSTKEIFKKLKLDWDLAADRKTVWETMGYNAEILHGWLNQPSMQGQLPAFGLTVNTNVPPSVFRKNGKPTLEVHSVRVARRRGFRGTLMTDLVVEVRQRRRGCFNPNDQKALDNMGMNAKLPPGDFRFRRGCTLIIDPIKQEVRYAISTRGNVADNEELDRVRRFITGEAEEVENPFYGSAPSVDVDGEHFAAVHRRAVVVPDF